jgi:phage terminase large subunit-like protein
VQEKQANNSWPPAILTPVSQAEIDRGDGQIAGDFIECLTQTKDTVAGRVGEQLQLRDWQRNLLNHLLARREDGRLKHRTALIGMARKNGKTTIGSGLALYSLFCGPEGGDVFSAAADKDQARLCFQAAKQMIEMSPDLSEQAKLYRDAIEVKATKSVYRVLSSESFTKEGLSPTLIVYDELHAAPTDELFNVLQLGSGARRDPLMLGITTAGVRYDQTGLESTCFRLFQYGQRVAMGEVDDPSFFCAWWQAPIDADYRNPETWQMANPGYGDLNDPEDFESSIKRTPEAEFRTKRINQWVSSQQIWLPTGTFEGCANGEAEPPDGVEVVLGFDGSFSGDASVIVGCTTEEKPHIFLIKAWEKQLTDRDDWRVDIAEVEQTIIEACKRWQVREIVCDPFRWQRSMQVLADEGLPVVEYPSSSPSRMVPACAKFRDAVTAANVTHDNSPTLLRHMNNCVVKSDRLGPRIVKEHKASSRKIDAAVAAIIAFDRATITNQAGEIPVPAFFAV